MQHDPAIDHAGNRLSRFLDRSIRELKGKSPMPEIPANPINGKKVDDLVPSLTGASQLATSLTMRIAAAKAKVGMANTKVDAAFGKFDNVAASLEAVAKKVEAEADAALAQIGQVSNLGGE